jgi:hypothetical protein
MTSGHTEVDKCCEGHGVTAVLIVLGLVLGALCLDVLRSVVTNEDVDEQ